MFAKRLDEIMNIAGVSNSTTGRATAISGAHIGRLRNGTRPLPKEHDFLTPLCEYLARHITKDYQLTALVNLTGMNEDSAGDSQKTALYLENWLQEKPEDSAAGRFISGFSSYAAVSGAPSQSETLENEEKTDSESYYYGNEGKRRAVIRFFHWIRGTWRRSCAPRGPGSTGSAPSCARPLKTSAATTTSCVRG